jgi:sentrin-specific protease 1
VINFHLSLLLRRQLAKDGSQPRVHFHSTFFYNKLYRDQHEYNYKAVVRWTSEKKLGYNVLKCDQIVVPVHQEMHWVLAVIDIKKRDICYMDSLGGVDRMCQARATLLRPGWGCAVCMATAHLRL